MKNRSFGFTLIEVLISIVLLSVIAIGFSGIELTVRNQSLGAERRSKIQNEVSIFLEHIRKTALKAIGDANNLPFKFVGSKQLWIFVDGNNNGIRDMSGPGPDHWSVYELQTPSAGLVYSIIFYPDFTNQPTQFEYVANNIYKFVSTYSSFSDNYFSLSVTGCWNLANTATCGSIDNPSVTMNSLVSMPSVSTQ